MTAERVSTMKRIRAVSSVTLDHGPGQGARAVRVRDDRHADPHAVIGPGVDARLPREVRRIAARDPHRQELHVERLRDAEQLAQLPVLARRLRELGDSLLRAGERDAKLGVLASEPIDLADRAEQPRHPGADAGQRLAYRIERPGRDALEGLRRLGRAGEQHQQAGDREGGEPEAGAAAPVRAGRPVHR